MILSRKLDDVFLTDMKSFPLLKFNIDETHVDSVGDEWFIISSMSTSLYEWLSEQAEFNEEKCGHAAPDTRNPWYPRFNIHGSLLSYISMRWS